ncbi:FAS1 domain-containing protein AFUA_8G05360 [Talaromyces islandicus]|uniref:FAS1 domain-containing protein AFUA_8G05360 n=1 Tax=Talaromyces islandicus TaxID=28573 RepID=A0A0U1M7U2_TALIS|nr:FAS1 domain-containing protein AFUA_8G05360 [Talaromyces islandicus]
MRNFQNIQLALYSVIVASILVWLLIGLLDNAALAIGGYFDECDQTISHEITAEPIHDHQTLKELLEEFPSKSIIMPPDDGSDHSNLIISDILAKTPRINVFSSLTRDFDLVSSRLNDKTQNTTVLVPLNSAISDLPRKPWEDPEDYERYGEVNAYGGPGGQERAQRNLQRFVEAHLVPTSPWAEGEEVATVGGGKVKWVKEGDKIFIEPGHVEVDTVAPQVSNGEVWVLKGVINYK